MKDCWIHSGLILIRNYNKGILKCNNLVKIQLTTGDWCIECDENVNVDEKNHLIYFTAYQNPIESHL